MSQTPHAPGQGSIFDADPSLGLTVPARGGLEASLAAPSPHQNANSQVPADGQAGRCFVRPATREDLPAVGQVHAATMLASLDAAHRCTHGSGIPAGVAAMMSAPVLEAGWEQAVAVPPSPAHHVLVATADDEVVGLIASAPSVGVPVEDADSPVHDIPADRSSQGETACEIIALGVHPAAQRKGHGSRLLAAVSDMARRDGASVLLFWAVRGDSSLEAFLSGAGLERTRSHRQLPVGQGIVEDCWAAILS